jgi:hypothetical protein
MDGMTVYVMQGERVGKLGRANASAEHCTAR